MTNRRLWIALVLLLCLVPSAGADGALTPALDGILDAPALKGGITGAIVVRVSDGATLYAHNPDTRLLPASNRKLFTTAAALEGLGSDFTYTTQALAQAKPDAEGTLHGGLYLHGVGDSSLQTKDLDDLAAQVAQAGVRRVTGSLYADGSAFTDGPYGQGWEWDDLGDEEFPQIAGLEVNDGDVAVRAVAGKAVGDSVAVTLDPRVAWPLVANSARTGTADAAKPPAINRPYDGAQILVTGVWPPGTVVKQNIPVVDPPRYAAEVFLRALKAHGITVKGVVGRGAAPPGASVLAAHT
ncbi:MAG: D-alanyl-D-alanine carboxypeptidase/D-alanyl-D-alanine-endopeptidase, partial [Armatimonadota bacterium]|nr:D-alanyl-D-alanine carboxypeptidase/D-alanyl-D-alanine-endopeptidase [Armatimonadota bacterium]